jgi:hypothetical protein
MPWINLTVRRGNFSKETQHAVITVRSTCGNGFGTQFGDQE